MDKAAVTLGVGIRLFSIFGALAVVLAVPLAYFFWYYQLMAGELNAEAQFAAYQIEKGFSAKDKAPRFDESNLRKLLTPPPSSVIKEKRQVLDVGGKLIAEYDDTIADPLITRRYPVIFKSKVVGYVQISRSISPLVYHTVLAGLISLFLGSLTFAFSWAFPLRAMNIAMNEIELREKTEENLNESLATLTATLESTVDAILVTDRIGSVVRFNESYQQMWGVEPDDNVATLRAFTGILDRLENRYTFMHRLKSLRQNPDLESHDNLALSDGRFIECSSRPQKAQGVIIGRVWNFRDITDRKQSEALLIAENNVLEMIATGAKLPDILNMLTRYMEDRDRSLFCAIFLLDESGTELKTASSPCLPKELTRSLEGPISARGIAAMAAAKDRGQPVVTMDTAQDSLWSRHQDFALSVGLQSTNLCPVIASNGNLLGVLTAYYREEQPFSHVKELIEIGAKLAGIAVERFLTEQHLDYMAHYDALTKLPNRILLIDRLERMIAMARRNKTQVAVMFIDLDKFKMINDTLGHALGDELLQEVAWRLKHCLREEDTIARLGGDEFVLGLGQIRHTEDVVHLAHKILHTVEKHINLRGREVFISASIGISIFPDDAPDMESLMKHADTAMYQAKSHGRNTYQFYSAEMNASALEQLDLEARLRKAVDNDEFFVHYQPIVDPRESRVSGMEALLRWQHPELGVIPPGKFIPILEETGLIIPVGEWILRTTCSQTKKWHDMGLEHLQVGVNISPRQFKDQDLPKTIERVLIQTGLNPASLKLEITESLLIEDAEHATTQISKIKELGVKDFAIDDFGIGYSSLSYISTLPVSTVKLDKLFVDGLPREKSNAAIAKAVLAMVHHLDMRLIAEGVENNEQLSFLVNEGCDEIQGFYFSRPLPADEFQQFVMKPRLVDATG